MKKMLLIAFICAFTGLISSGICDDAPQTDGVWVSVTVSEDKIEYECCGIIAQSDFFELTQGEYKRNMLQLQQVYWYDAKKKCMVKIEETRSASGQELGYTNTVYFKTKAVLCIIPLKTEFVKKLLAPKDEKQK